MTLQCTYCSLAITDDSYLHCDQCGGDVHVKCLRHASTPGDLYGDVFYDFTCAKCMQLQYEGPSTSKALTTANGDGIVEGGNTSILEKFIRQRMPWLLVITIAIYNLSIKSKGLSRHGYFHWRTHIVNFIDKNWDYLFDPTISRRKKWTGSISGALSHNSPKYFTSGQELFDETGWWKLTLANKTPKYIYSIYEQQCLKRQQMRHDKRQLEDSYASDTSNNDQDTKRLKRHESDEDLVITDSCSRTIPYMGRKPKIAKQLNILDDDLLSKQTNSLLPLEDSIMPLNTVQSSLMDFLAESLASDDLNMFNTLPNMASEPLVDGTGKNDLMPLLEAAHNDNANFFENPSLIKAEPMDLNGHLYSDYNTQAMLHEKLKSFYANSPFSNEQPTNFNNIIQQSGAGIGKNILENYQLMQENSLHTNTSEFSNELDDDNTTTTTSSSISKPLTLEEEPNDQPETEDETDSEEFQPRIVQVTNFQQLTAEGKVGLAIRSPSPVKTGKLIKLERKSHNELNDNELKSKENDYEDDDADDHSSELDDDIESTLKACKPSLFNKHPKRRWPWLIENRSDVLEEEDLDSKPESESNTELIMMSEYEEKELLQKLRKIFALEVTCKIHIPPYIRRFYRKLCIREWKREHGKPLFNLDDYIDENKRNLKTRTQNDKSKIIERYQLISLSSSDAKKSFYARIAGSSQYELFESPYTQRVLHPFIYRNKKCCPPFLKLMCELQYKVNGTPPSRAPIDFCYVRPNHIAAVNALLQTVFWPGIDMSECLSYPDFSVVALYKKLVIGCGFLVPDVGFNEAYISFMAVRPGWQRSGIATFMLYHLIQTCMTKDITLHVSATNPAVVLYQKFGFKIEEVILNFYEKYLPLDSKHSRHAFFLRLMR